MLVALAERVIVAAINTRQACSLAETKFIKSRATTRIQWRNKVIIGIVIQPATRAGGEERRLERERGRREEEIFTSDRTDFPIFISGAH